MAYCYFNTGGFEMAKACALRILQLDSRNIEAVILLAIVYERSEDYINYFNYLK